MFRNNDTFTNKTVNINKYINNGFDINGNIIYNEINCTININEFINILNSISSSKNAIEICNSLGNFNNKYYKNLAVQYSITYKKLFKDQNKNYKSLQILRSIGFDDVITVNNNIIRNIIYIKTKLYEFKQKQQIDNIVAEWIGILAGLFLYFDEIDERNYNNTKFLLEVTKPLTIYNF